MQCGLSLSTFAGEGIMKTIQMTLDDELVATVDQVVKKLKTTRLLLRAWH
jgi:hypothetical protein